MRHLSVFTGIGVFDLAAQNVGWELAGQVEIDPFCNQVLERRFGKVNRYKDVKDFSAKKYRGTIGALSAGFPCQPFSKSGNQAGQNDYRYLWPELLRIIIESGTRWLVLENVTGIAKMALAQIISDLEAIGYSLPKDFTGTPIVPVIPAIAAGGDHRRDRVWIIAHADSYGWEGALCNDLGNERETISQTTTLGTCSSPFLRFSESVGKSAVLGMDDGTANRVHRLGAVGNAIHYPIALEIFKTIDLIERL